MSVRVAPDSAPSLKTMLEVMQDRAKSIEDSKWVKYINQLDPIAKEYFRTQHFTRDVAGTRQQVANRLFTVLGNPIFERMFNAKKNTFNAFEAMQAGKIVLVNTSMLALRAQASSVFGRYIIAQCLAAAYQRPLDQRNLCLLIIDEASAYFDETTETILSEARKYGLGMMFATQHLDQLPDEVRRSMAGNTVIKIAGPISNQDARYLAPEMRTTPEFLRSMQKTSSYAEFAVHIRNQTPRAVRVQVPFGVVEAQNSAAKERPAEPVAHADHDEEDSSEFDGSFDASDFDPSQPTTL
jgi:TraM recognition site of TraD and TraG